MINMLEYLLCDVTLGQNSFCLNPANLEGYPISLQLFEGVVHPVHPLSATGEQQSLWPFEGVAVVAGI